jgi:murein DD-endopeptidase MepM/ murein hydrolase activator NlpD
MVKMNISKFLVFVVFVQLISASILGFGDSAKEVQLVSLHPSERILEIKQERTPKKPTTAGKLEVKKFTAGDETWRLPYSAGARVYQDQGYFGGFSHQGSYALDMRAPNQQIVAARNGTIATINFGGKWDQWCNSNTDCYNKGGVWRGNHIIMNHNDGSTSFYFHMRPGTLAGGLWVGKYIDQGTPLGIEGYTGYTCLDLVTPCTTPDPHIHFQVNKNGKSIPTYFDDCNYLGNQCNNGVPVEGRTYTSANFAPGAESNNRTSKINYFGTDKAVGVFAKTRGSTAELGYENEDISSRWDWQQNGEIKGLNEWCLAGEGGNIVLRDCNGLNNQKWVRGSNNSIRNVESGLCWDSYFGDAFRSRVYLYSCHGGANQRWRIGNEPYIAKPIE